MVYSEFTYPVTKDRTVLVSRGGRLVTTVRGAAAAKLIPKLGISAAADQGALQRVTGHYRHGNER